MFDQEKWRAETHCDVCGRQGVVGVASSSMSAISLAYCQECLIHCAEPEYMFAFTYHMTGKGNVPDWVKGMTTWRNERYWPWDEWKIYADKHPEEFPDPIEDYNPDDYEPVEDVTFEDTAPCSSLPV